MAFSLLIGIPTGIIAAVRVNQWWDSAGKVFALLGLSLPSFWVGLLLILFFSVYLGWLPSSGSGTAAHLLMPAFALGWYFAAAHMRLTRSSMLDVLGSEYVKLARLKGLPEALVIGKHAFKNALIPVLTLAGINLVIMVNVAVVVETVFAWPGIGRLLYEGIAFRDFPVVQATVHPERRHGRGREPARRHPLRGDRPADPVRPMNGARAATLTTRLAPPLRFRTRGLPADPARRSWAACSSWRSSPTCSPRTIPRWARSGSGSGRRSGSRAAARSSCSGAITWAATCSPA